MNELVTEFRKHLTSQYGTGACEVEVLARRFLCLWDKTRRAFHCEGKAVMLLPVGDPAYEWVNFVARNLVLDSLRGFNDERHSSEWVDAGFVFHLIAPPGADGETIVRLAAEAMKRSSPTEWSRVCAIASSDYILDGCDSREKMQRYLWSAIARVRELAEDTATRTGRFACSPVTTFFRAGEEMDVGFQVSFGRRDHVPFFIVTSGENIGSAGIYEMQDLALRCGCRFLILASSEEPENFHHEFGGEMGVSSAIYDLLDYEPAIANPSNVIAGVIEATLLVRQMEEWCAAMADEDEDAIAERLTIPFTVSTAVINSLRDGHEG